MNLYTKLFLVFLTSILTACNTMPKQAAGTKKDLTQMLAELKYLSNHGLIDPYEIPLLRFNNVGKTTINGVNEYRRFWCTLLPSEEMNKHIQTIGKGHCNNFAGEWDGKWCSKNGTDPIFYIDTTNIQSFITEPDFTAPYCTSGRVFSVIASTSEAADPEKWRSRAVNVYHYKTKSELANIKQMQEIKSQNALIRKQEEKRANAMEVMARGLGSRVCKKISTHSIFTGFVEQFEKDRMQIRVTDKQTAGFSQNGFTPTLFWDEISNWYPCDSQTERELRSN